LKSKAAVAAIFTIVIAFGLAAPALNVQAQTLGSQIEQVFPTDRVGVVGQGASVFGSIDTRNGRYEVFFGTFLVANGTAQDNSVSVSFKIPETPAGQYRITLRDVTLNNNGTSDFTVNTAYLIEATVPSDPAQLQEGTVVALNISVTGGQPNVTYMANVTVTLPAPLSTNHSRAVALPTSSQKGTSTTQINYPDIGFEPSGAVSNYAGLYKVYFNPTQSLGSSQFNVGFTEMKEYHRGQSVKIRATGYTSNDTATVTVKNQESGATLYSTEVRPTSEGMVIVDWVVPTNAAIGKFDINVTARNNPKAVPDQQVITVPGYPISIRVLDLSGAGVPQIVVEALDTATNKTYPGTSESEGNASINLESGRHILTAFWNSLQVGATSVTVAGEGGFDLQCELTNLKITVKDRNGLLIPSVNFGVSYEYLTTREGQRRTGSITGETDLSGVYTLNSTPPRIAYVINASVYGAVFNGGNDTLNELAVAPVSEVTILCPSRTLKFKITDYNREAISDARLALIEVTAGIFYSNTTDGDGSATVEATFGRYRTQVFSGSVLLNETEINAFSNMEVQIQCVLYNLNVKVAVTDYFGQPIGNVNVRLAEPDGTMKTEKTQDDGTAIFNRVIAGDLQITAYLNEGDDYYEAKKISIDSPTTVTIRMGRYITLGGALVQTSMFIALIVILPVFVLFLLLEVYNLRKSRSKKPSPTV